MSKKNVLDSLLDAITSATTTANDTSGEQPTQKPALSDKIPSAHSDMIITMILCNSNDLFADNRKRKPIFNARRKAKWTELVENLNRDLDMNYSVERVKNNYHYRITSLKRTVSRMINTLKEGEEVTECAAFQQLPKIDKLLFAAIKTTTGLESNEVPVKRKKVKTEKRPIDMDNYSVGSPTVLSTDDQTLDQCIASANLPSKLDDQQLGMGFEGNDEELKSSLARMIRIQSETLETMKQFMKDNLLQQAKILELVNCTTEILREATSNLSRVNNPNPCPTCTNNFIETFLQACNNNNSSKLVPNLTSKKNGCGKNLP